MFGIMRQQWNNWQTRRRLGFRVCYGNRLQGAQVDGYGKGSSLVDCRIQGQLRIGRDTKIVHTRLSGNITVGHCSSINGPNTALFSKHNPITVGNYTSIGHNVTLIEYDHRVDLLSTAFLLKQIDQVAIRHDTVSKGPIQVGSDVWIGTGAIVMSGIVIGNGAVIGAGSVVTKNVPSYAIVAGNPARIIRDRFARSIVERLERLAWYDRDLDQIQTVRDLLSSPLTIELIDAVELRLLEANSRSIVR